MATARKAVAPLALAQFIASYAATTMAVSISTIALDLGTTVSDVQAMITLFTLTMASLMVPGSKLTDLWGRKACFTAGLTIYGVGALVATLAPTPWVLLVGYSVLEGVGSALMIPPIYILVTVAFDDVADRARSFGLVSAAGGLGAAAGPLLGGLVTSAFGWRASFLVQVLVVAGILVVARKLVDRRPVRRKASFDVVGAVLSAAGLFLVVLGVLRAGTLGWDTWPVWAAILLGALVLAWFGLHVRGRERAGLDPLCPPALFRDRGTVLGLATQLVQWLVLQGAFIALSVYVQQVHGLDAVRTGLALAPAVAGVLVAAAVAERLARRYPQRRLVRAGFAVTAVGVALLLWPVLGGSGPLALAPGQLLLGVGLGTMLTSSVTLVQSAWPEDAQGAVSGVSRAASNLGSSLGTALAGTAVAAGATAGGTPYAAALALLGGFTVAGFGMAVLLPGGRQRSHPS